MSHSSKQQLCDLFTSNSPTQIKKKTQIFSKQSQNNFLEQQNIIEHHHRENSIKSNEESSSYQVRHIKNHQNQGTKQNVDQSQNSNLNRYIILGGKKTEQSPKHSFKSNQSPFKIIPFLQSNVSNLQSPPLSFQKSTHNTNEISKIVLKNEEKINVQKVRINNHIFEIKTIAQNIAKQQIRSKELLLDEQKSPIVDFCPKKVEHKIPTELIIREESSSSRLDDFKQDYENQLEEINKLQKEIYENNLQIKELIQSKHSNTNSRNQILEESLELASRQMESIHSLIQAYDQQKSQKQPGMMSHESLINALNIKTKNILDLNNKQNQHEDENSLSIHYHTQENHLTLEKQDSSQQENKQKAVISEKEIEESLFEIHSYKPSENHSYKPSENQQNNKTKIHNRVYTEVETNNDQQFMEAFNADHQDSCEVKSDQIQRKEKPVKIQLKSIQIQYSEWKAKKSAQRISNIYYL